MVRTLVFIAMVVLVAAFAALNWGAITASTALNLGLSTVQAPLGLILLGLAVVLGVLFAGWAIGLQASALAATRRQGRELKAQRELADQAEASRFTELRAELVGRLDRLEAASKLELEQGFNAIAAQLGQLEDRLERPPPTLPR